MLNRAELYFEANKIEERRKVPVFLSVLGSKTYSVLRDLLAPAKPKDNRGGSRILGKGGLINIFTTGGRVREAACPLP